MKNYKRNEIICWWSGGVTSAIACKIAIDLFGIDNCRIVFIGTNNEDSDTYRFKIDCEKWYNKKIETISNQEYKTIEEVWFKFKSLNNAHGAICSSELKRAVRIKYQRENNNFKYQVFGFDIKEVSRARAMKINYPDSNPVFPLLLYALSKKDCIKMLTYANIDIPMVYKYGFSNNNCFNTGCVQGGIGYWQKIKREFPEKFETMAILEHELTDLKGKPVTILRDQSKKAKELDNTLVFLKKHSDYPNMKTINDMTGREPERLIECNGYCGLSDLDEKLQNK